jgi:hypothetical protein
MFQKFVALGFQPAGYSKHQGRSNRIPESCRLQTCATGLGGAARRGGGFDLDCLGTAE